MGKKNIDQNFWMNKIIIIFLVASLVLMMGIEGCPKETTDKTMPGLHMAFVEDAPKTTITTEQRILIYADILNGGGVHIGLEGAKFYLSGVGENLNGVKEKLTNRKFLDKEGGSERLEFATSAGTDLTLENPFMFPLTLTTCYDYETQTQVQSCIGEEKSDICNIGGEKINENSNSPAPVQITSFTEELEGNKLIITFEIENTGVNQEDRGQIYSRDSNCDLIHEKDINEVLNIGKVDVEITVGTGNDGFTCDLQEGVAKLSSIGKGKVICTKKLEDNVGDYLTPFKIKLRYKYVDSIGTAITILPA